MLGVLAWSRREDCCCNTETVHKLRYRCHICISLYVSIEHTREIKSEMTLKDKQKAVQAFFLTLIKE